jgi:hypothetical protein
VKQVALGVVEQSSAPGMALYSSCHTSIHNIEVCHSCFTILIVYQSMLSSFMSYAKVLVRLDDPSTDRGSLCFRACSSALLVHPKGGRPGDTRIVTSCMSVVLGYVRSFGYDRAPRCDWGRWQVVTALSVRRNSCVAFSIFPDVRVRCSSSCKEVTGLDVLRWGTFSPLSHFPGTCSPNHVQT